MAENIVQVKCRSEVVNEFDCFDLKGLGRFTLASKKLLGFHEAVEYCLERGALPITADEYVAVFDRLRKQDNANEYALAAGTLSVQHLGNGFEMVIDVCEPQNIAFWKEFLLQIPRGTNYFDIKKDTYLGKQLLATGKNNRRIVIHPNDVCCRLSDHTYSKNDSVIKIFPKNAKLFERIIQEEFPKQTHGMVWYPREFIPYDMRVSPFGVGQLGYYLSTISGVGANASDYKCDGIARGKLLFS